MKFTQGKLNLNHSDMQSGMQDEVDMLFAGDLCMWMRAQDLILSGKSDEILSTVYPLLHNKDISIVNLESPLSKSRNMIKKIGPGISVDPGCVDFIVKAGFDVACLANNHIADCGPEAVMETIDLLKNKNIVPVGAGKNIDDAKRTVFFKRNNINIALIAVTEDFEIGTAEENMAGPSPLDALANIKDIKEAATKADITIVLVHAGCEHNPLPNPGMVQIFRSFVDAGASAVIGTHPHCPQGLEIYNGCPIIYSLGNFLFDINYPKLNPDDSMWWRSYMVKILFGRKGALKLEVIPYTFAPDASRIKVYEEDEKEDFIQYLEYISNIITDQKELQMFWYAWCKMKGLKAVQFLKGAVDLKEPQDDEISSELLGARVALSSVTHKEIMSTYLKMVCDRKIDIADNYIPRIQRLQKGKQWEEMS